MLKHLVFLLSVLLVVPATAQKPRLVEKIEKKGSEPVIPYTRYEYPNGLTLLVHEDHSDPVVHVDVTYHVGSAREESGKSGFAHFFEHMMFQGSDHVKDEEHFKMVTEAGGTMNGSTNMDRTNYFQTVPANMLERVLWLEADRMGFLLDAVTQQKFEVQRSTVKNERGQRYDNRPYGLIREKINQALYPYGHPYSWPTIGYLADLDRVDVEDLKKFFLRWYGPNNAVITVAGDVKTDDVVKQVDKYFGSIPRGPAVKPMEKQAPVLETDRYISYEDNIRFPYLQLTWPTVPAGHDDGPALEAAANILSYSKSSPLSQSFEKTGKAMNATAYNYSQELAGSFAVSMMLVPGNHPGEAEREIRSLLSGLESAITTENLRKFILRKEVETYRRLESVSYKASQLAHFFTIHGDPNLFGKELKAYQSLTTEKVREVLEKYINSRPAVIISVYPKGEPSLVAQVDNYKPKLPDPTGSDPSLYGDLKYVKAGDSFDRSRVPAAGPAPVVKIPELWKHNFKGTSRAIGIKSDESPMVTAVLYFPAGHIYEDPGKAGLAALTARLMNEGTLRLTPEELADKLESLGSSIYFSGGEDHITASITSLNTSLDSTIALAREMLLHPRFSQEDFEREKKKNIEQIKNRSTQPSAIADQVFTGLIHGDGDIRGIPAGGTLSSVEGLTPDDVKKYHEFILRNAAPDLVVVGNISADEAKRKFAFLDQFTAAKPALPALKPAGDSNNRYYLVHRPGAAQSEIRVGYLALPYDATGEFFKATVMNYPFGGSFNSRINLNLREDKGFTYGVRGYFQGKKYPGPYQIATGVRTDATDSALAEIFTELESYTSNGIRPDELQFTKSSLGMSEALRYETPSQKAGFLHRLQEYNLSPQYTAEQQKLLNSFTVQDISATARKFLPVQQMVVVIVGDREAIGEALKKRGYQFTELDSEGNPL